MLQVRLKQIGSHLDAVTLDSLPKLTLVVLLLLISFPGLLLKDEVTTIHQLLIRLYKQCFHTNIPKA
jgi:hypothetical protein